MAEYDMSPLFERAVSDLTDTTTELVKRIEAFRDVVQAMAAAAPSDGSSMHFPHRTPSAAPGEPGE